MLVASRDPFHPGAHDVSSSQGSGAAPRFTHAMSVLQIVGTLLAIPVGIGSAYTMYRANFSVETTCQSLRANIVAMLDKSVDASTRHMLVRRDVEAFENACRTVDPDATAAFKALLAADKTAAPVVTATTRRAEPRAGAVAHKAEPRPEVAAKRPAANNPVATAEATPVQRDASSDAVWVAAVRRALVAHAPEPAPPAEPVKVTAVTLAPPAELAKPTAVMLTAPTAPPASRDMPPLGEERAQPMTLAPPASAPALPPAVPVAIAPAPQADDGHPVPPAPIPEMSSVPKEASANTAGHARSRLGGLAAQIPLVGWAFDR